MYKYAVITSMLLPLTMGCAIETKTKINDVVICANGNCIFKIDLFKKEKIILYQSDRTYPFFSHLNINRDEIILSALENDGSAKILSYDYRKSKFKYICEGQTPLYINKTNCIFYNRYVKKNSAYKNNLYKRNMSSNEEVFVSSNIYNLAVPVKISDSEILYLAVDKKWEIYDYVNGSIRTINICGYTPYFYLNKQNSLICEGEDQNYYLINIVTLNVKRINICPNGWNIVAIPGQECVLYTQFRPITEIEDVRIYWIQDDRNEIYMKNMAFASAVLLK